MSLITPELPGSPSPELKNSLPIDSFKTFRLSIQEALAHGIQPEQLLLLDQIVIACGTGNCELSEKIATAYRDKYDCESEFQETMHPLKDHVFQEGERKPGFKTSLRNKRVVIVQSFTPPRLLDNGQPNLETGINDQLVELQLMIDAAHQANAKEIIVVMPYCAYLRQDRKRSGEPISAAALLSTYGFLGADSLCILDPHNIQVLGSFSNAVDVAPAHHIFLPTLLKMVDLQNTMGLSPDTGGVKRVSELIELLFPNCGGAIFEKLAFISKIRNPITNETQSSPPVGIKKDSTVIISDDILSSGQTIFTAAQLARQAGAKRVIAVVTHGLFVGNCLNDLRACPELECIITTNSIDHRREVREEAAKPDGKIIIIDIAEYLADVIHCILSGDPMHRFFDAKNGIVR